MPERTPALCNKPGCPDLTTDSSGYCAKHRDEPERQRRQYDRCRGSSTHRGYGSRWQRTRADKLAADPLCERCRKAGKVVRAVLVHHKDRNPRNNAPGNLESLCFDCHSVEHCDERWGRG